MDRFKIRVALDIDEAQGYAEIKKSIASIQAKLGGMKLDIDTKKARSEMDKLNKKTKELNKNVKGVTASVGKYKKKTKEAAKGNEKFGQTLTDKVMKFAIWTAIATAIYGTINAIKEAITTVMDIETSMTNFKIVADATEGQLDRVDSQVNALVGTLGALKSEVTDTATEFARAGFSISESMIMAEQAIIGARTGFTSLSQVSETMIVTLRAFNLESIESKNIVNDLFVASKTAAVTFEELGQGLKRSANSMAIAGATFEETISLISGANETVQDASKVGSALKTISARLRGIDEASNLPKLTGQMERFGVSIENGAGGFRNIYDIMEDLAVAFKDSSDEFQKQAVLESLAGKRRANVLVGLLNNWEKVEQVRNRALSTSEEATESQREILETANGQLELMAGNWQVFVDGVLDSEIILGVLSTINASLKAINYEMTKASEGKRLDEALMGDGSKLSETIQGGLGKYGTAVREVKDAMDELASDTSAGYFDDQREKLQALIAEGDNIDALSGRLEVINRMNENIADTQAKVNALAKERTEIEREGGRGSSFATIQKTNEIEEAALQLVYYQRRLSEIGVVGGDVEPVIEAISEALELASESTEEATQVTNNLSDALFVNSSEFEWYAKRFKDLTDDQKSEMESLLQADLDTTLEQIQLSKDRIDMYGAEDNIFAASIQKRINAMAGLSMLDEAINEQMIRGMKKRAQELIDSSYIGISLDHERGILDGLEDKYKDISSKYDNFFGEDSDKGNSGKSKKAEKLTETLSESEVALRTLQHEIVLLEDELKNTDGYDEQIRVTNELLEKKKEEKTMLEELADSQKTAWESMAETTNEEIALKQDAQAEYQKTVEEIGKVTNEIGTYEESLVSLNQQQEDMQFENFRDRFEQMTNDVIEKGDELESELTDNINTIQSALDSLDAIDLTFMTDDEALAEAKTQVGNILDTLKNADIDDYDGIIDNFEEYIDVIDSSFDEVISGIKDTAEEAIDASKDMVKSLKSEMQSLNSFLNNLEIDKLYSNVETSSGFNDFIGDNVLSSVVGVDVSTMGGDDLIEYSQTLQSTYGEIQSYYSDYISQIEANAGKEIDVLNEMHRAFAEFSNGKIDDEKESVEDRKDVLDENLENLIESKENEIETLKNSKEASNEILDDELEELIEAEEGKTKVVTDNIDERITAINDEIEALKRTKDETSYTDERQEIIESISDLELEKQKLLVDESLTADARRREIEEEMLSYRDKLADIEADRNYELQVEKLNDEKNTLKEELTEVGNATTQKIKDAKEVTASKKEELDKQIDAEIEMVEKSIEGSKRANKAKKESIDATFETFKDNIEQEIIVHDNMTKTKIINVKNSRDNAIGAMQARQIAHNQMIEEEMAKTDEAIAEEIALENKKQTTLNDNMLTDVENEKAKREEFRETYRVIDEELQGFLTNKKDIYSQDLDNLQTYMDDFGIKVEAFESNWTTFGENISEAFSNGMKPELESVLDMLEEITGIDYTSEIDLTPPNEAGNTNPPPPQEDVSEADFSDENIDITEEEINSVKDTIINSPYLTDDQKADKLAQFEENEDKYYHSGGVIGGKKFTKESSFMDYMTGLKSDERQIIGRVGETVVTEAQMKFVASGSGNSGNQFGSALSINELNVSASSDVDVKNIGNMLGAEVRKSLVKQGRT